MHVSRKNGLNGALQTPRRSLIVTTEDFQGLEGAQGLVCTAQSDCVTSTSTGQIGHPVAVGGRERLKYKSVHFLGGKQSDKAFISSSSEKEAIYEVMCALSMRVFHHGHAKQCAAFQCHCASLTQVHVRAQEFVLLPELAAHNDCNSS